MPRPTASLRILVMVTLVSVIGVLGVGAASVASAAPLSASSTKKPGATTPRAVTTWSALPRTARPAAPRSMWVWDTSDPQAVVSLASSRGIGQLYAAVPPNVTTSPALAELRSLVSLADAAGIRVDALGGDPGWVDNRSWVVTNWLKPVLATGLFTGVHVDIEPYSTPAWTTDQQGVVTKYLATLDALRKAAGTTQIEADIPFWFDGIAANRSTLDREIMKRTSAVTVMAYRRLADGADGTIALSANEVRAGAALGVPVRIGQETNHLGDDPVSVKQTFYGQTLTQMESQLSLVLAAYAGSPSFAGLAIHDSIGYAAITG